MPWMTDDWTFLALPHSGSTSTISFLRRHFPVKKVGGKHDMEPRQGLTWAIWRDPMDRAIAMWKKQNVPGNLCGEACAVPGKDFEQDFARYTKALAEEKMEAFHDHRRVIVCSQREAIGEEPDVWLKFRQFPRCLTQLPFIDHVEDFPHVQGDVRPQDPVITDEATENVRRWAEKDFA